MNPEHIITGLDIGSSKTTAVIGQAMPADARSAPYLKILGVGQARTTGLRRGIVSDIEETTRSIEKRSRTRSEWRAPRSTHSR
jgi:cell division protein FtsA